MTDSPDHYADLEATLASDATATDTIALIFDLPPPSALPRPSQVRAWEFSDWLTWGKPYGFTDAGQTAHQFTARHRVIPTLRIGMATSTGDVKSRMNLGQDVRNLIRGEYGRLGLICRAIFTHHGMRLRTSWDGKTTESLHSALRTVVLGLSDTELAAISITGALGEIARCDTDETRAAAKKAHRLLLKAAALRNESPRATLARARPMAGAAGFTNDDDSETLYRMVASETAMPLEAAATVIEALQCYIEIEETLIEDAKEAKKRERDQAAAERQRRKAAEAAEQQEVVVAGPAAFAAHMAAVRGRAQELSKLVASATDELKTRVADLAKHATGFASPAYPTDRLQALEAEKAALSDKLDNAMTETQALQDLVDTVQRKLSEADRDRQLAEQLLSESATSSAWLSRYRDLVTQLDSALASSDFLRLAEGISLARLLLTDAKKLLETEGTTSPRRE